MSVVELRGTNGEPSDTVASAERTLDGEIAALQTLRKALRGPLGTAFDRAVEVMARCPGRIIVTGMGKSGHISAKISATLASTGSPAQFVHPAEASHGDLGMITANDVILALSWSGETRELAPIIAYAKRFKVPVVAITSRAKSALGRAADIALVLPAAPEACPLGLAPTSSAMEQLAIGDALAVALIEMRGFTSTDFHTFHPGGRLGARLSFVRDLMHMGDAVPLAERSTMMSEAIIIMTQKGFGTLGVVDDAGHLCGIITDGDLRRHLQQDLLSQTVQTVMSPTPKTIGGGAVASAALDVMNGANISVLFVVDDGVPVGILHMHDLLRAGVV